MPEGEDSTPDLLKRCVVDVAEEDNKDIDRAFAICIDNFQEHGYMKEGSTELTQKGEKQNKEKKNDPEHKDRIDKYEKLLDQRNESKKYGRILRKIEERLIIERKLL